MRSKRTALQGQTAEAWRFTPLPLAPIPGHIPVTNLQLTLLVPPSPLPKLILLAALPPSTLGHCMHSTQTRTDRPRGRGSHLEGGIHVDDVGVAQASVDADLAVHLVARQVAQLLHAVHLERDRQATLAARCLRRVGWGMVGGGHNRSALCLLCAAQPRHMALA
eukprot:362611-Chlamydomonas_euryale.AAC.2